MKPHFFSFHIDTPSIRHDQQQLRYGSIPTRRASVSIEQQRTILQQMSYSCLLLFECELLQYGRTRFFVEILLEGMYQSRILTKTNKEYCLKLNSIYHYLKTLLYFKYSWFALCTNFQKYIQNLKKKVKYEEQIPLSFNSQQY